MYAEIGDAVRCDAEIGPGKVRTIVVQIFFLFPFPWNAHRFLNRQRDYKDGKNLQLYAQSVDTKLRDDIERLKKIRNHRGLRHYWCVKVPAPEGVGRVRQSLALCCNEASLLKLFCK